MRGSVLPGLRSRALVLALLLLAFPSVLAGQTVSDPTTVEFNASPDHAAMFEGIALVSGYVLNIYPNGSTTVVLSVPLGKPAPDAAGLIRMPFPSSARASLTPGLVYESRVAATGPGGSAESSDSNTFAITAPVVCTPVISPASAAVAIGGGGGTVTVTVGTGCAWSASSNSSWLTVTSGSSGNGNGSVAFSAAANTGASSRNGSLTIAGQAFTVSQPGATPACSYSVSPATRSVAAAATSGTVSVTAGSGCAWSASSNVAWITVTGGASGSGAGTVSYSVAANTSTSSRSGTITVEGDTLVITQAAATSPSCSYAISPASRSIGTTVSAGSIAVTAAAGCAWSATSNVSWISVTAGASGSGNGAVTYSVSANSGAARTGTLSVGGQTFTLSQTGTCSFSVTPSSITVSASGGSPSVSVATTSGCTWSGSDSVTWVSGGGSRTGTGSVTFTVSANTGNAARNTTVVVAGQSIPLTQPSVSSAPAPSVPSAPKNVRIVVGGGV